MRLVPRLAALALAGFTALMGSSLSVTALEVRTLRIPMAAGPEGLDAILVEADGAGGGFAWRTASASTEGAQGQALAKCRELTHAGIYALDDGYAP